MKMEKGKSSDLGKLITAAKQSIAGNDKPDDLQAAVTYYLTSLERSCQLRGLDDFEMLRRVIDDQIWTGIQFIQMLQVVPPECWEKRVYSEAGIKSRQSFKKKTDEAEAYVAQRIKEVRLTRSTDASDTAYDIHATWDPKIPKRGIRWIEDRVRAAKKQLTKLHVVK
jgi:hypothetical protein